MHFRQKKVFLDHVFFFFFNGKPGHRGPTHPILMENSLTFIFLKPSISDILDLNLFGKVQNLTLTEHFRPQVLLHTIYSLLVGKHHINRNVTPPILFFSGSNTNNSTLEASQPGCIGCPWATSSSTSCNTCLSGGCIFTMSVALLPSSF